MSFAFDGTSAMSERTGKMGVWLTYEAKLEYHRKYNVQYRKNHREKTRGYQKECYKKRKRREMREETKKEDGARESHRLTVLARSIQDCPQAEVNIGGGKLCLRARGN